MQKHGVTPKGECAVRGSWSGGDRANRLDLAPLQAANADAMEDVIGLAGIAQNAVALGDVESFVAGCLVISAMLPRQSATG